MYLEFFNGNKYIYFSSFLPQMKHIIHSASCFHLFFWVISYRKLPFHCFVQLHIILFCRFTIILFNQSLNDGQELFLIFPYTKHKWNEPLTCIIQCKCRYISRINFQIWNSWLKNKRKIFAIINITELSFPGQLHTNTI